MLRHLAPYALKKRQIEVGRVVVQAIGVGIAAVEKFHVLGLQRVCSEASHHHAGFAHLAPLLADLLALVMRHGAEKLLEVLPVMIAPVKLHPASKHQPALLQRLRFFGFGKQHMQRGEAAGQFQRCIDQRQTHAGIARRDAGAGHRRERNRRQQLGVVVQSVALVGLGPGPVKHVFTARMRFQIQRHRPDQGIAVMRQQVLRLPAGAGAGAAGVVQGMQEGMRQHRLCAD